MKDLLQKLAVGDGLMVGIGGLTVAIMLQLALSLIRSKLLVRPLSSFRVTLLGPPGSGKTSAVIAVLDHMINSNLTGYLRLRGNSTINAVEEGILALNQGGFPPRTLEDSTNIYRMDYFPPRSAYLKILASIFPTPTAYRVEIADFAGELTEEFANSSRLMKNTAIPKSFSEEASSNYLKWVAESDRCLLFIDMEKYTEDGSEFVDLITAKYISFWQKYLDLHAVEMSRRSGTPVVIVHSKCDVLIKQDPKIRGTNNYFEKDALLRERCLRDFRKLYHYLNENSREVRIVLMSVVSEKTVEGRMGVADLAYSVLPDAPKREGARYTFRKRMLHMQKLLK